VLFAGITNAQVSDVMGGFLSKVAPTAAIIPKAGECRVLLLLLLAAPAG